MVYCPRCGWKNEDDARFCVKCGSSLAPPLEAAPRMDRVRISIENVKKDIRMRVETDTLMSYAWLLIYILPIIAGIILIFSLLTVAFSYTVMEEAYSTTIVNQTIQTQVITAPLILGFIMLPILMIVSFIVYVVLIYKLVKRRNAHLKRQRYLLEDTLRMLRNIAEVKGVDVEVELSSCERIVREVSMEETERNAVLWAILSAAIFIAHWYVNYFLMKDFYRHERREDNFWENIRTIMDRLGLLFNLPVRMESIPNRSFILYLILNLLTLGLFGVYWLYVLLRDPNKHFEYHIQVESELLRAITPLQI